MSSFRKVGGLNYATRNNIVRSNYSNNTNPNISNVLGQVNTKTVSESHIDMSNNYLLNTEGVYFMDGTL